MDDISKKYPVIHFEKDDRINDFFAKHWGNEFIVSDGKKLYGNDLSGLMILENNIIIGLLTYHVVKNSCEIITLNAVSRTHGIGTALINEMAKIAKNNNYSRLWLMTTNDNLDAMRFYQKRGFVLTAVHPDAIKLSRELGEIIPEFGDYGIPIRDEVELDYSL